MEHSSLGQCRRRRWAAIFFAAAALAIGACSSPNTESWLGAATSPMGASRARALTIEPTPVFTLQPVYYTGAHNEVTDINDESQIVGVYRQSSKYSSFTATCSTAHGYVDCSKTMFSPVPYSGAHDTYLNANDATDPQSYDAGYVTFSTAPPSVSCTTCGALYDENPNARGWLPNLLQDPRAATSGQCAVTQVLGINGAKVAVGFYETNTGSPCRMHAFEEYLLNNNPRYVDLNVKDTISNVTDSVATGIDNGGNVVGYVIKQGSNVQEGWYYHDGIYSPFYIGNNSTQPTGIISSNT